MNQLEFESHFKKLWENLKLYNHIVKNMKKKNNAKQASEIADNFEREIKKDIIQDLLNWYVLKKHFGEEIDENIIRNDVVHRINGELAKLGVPMLDTSILR